MAEDTQNLTEEDVFNDDKDPLEAIREIRKAEGVADEDLPESSLEDNDTSGQASADNNEDDGDDLGEIDPNTADTGDQNGDTDDDSDTRTENGTGDGTTSDSGSKGGVDGTDDSGTDEGDGDEEATAGSSTEVTGKKFKANGQEFEFSEKEIMDQFETVFGQAMNYTQKMQKIAPYRKMISALEQEGVTQDQLNIALDALKGDKGALQQIVKAHKIEALDLDSDVEDNPYQPTPYGKSETELDIDEVSSKIAVDKEYPITVDIIDNQWDGTSRKAFANNPSLIVGLHNDVKTGKYDQVAPVAMKMKVLDGSGKSDIEYYMLAGQQVAEQEVAAQDNAQQQTADLNQQTQDTVNKNEAASSEAQRKRSASSTRTRADRQGVVDYLDDDDEKFDNWYKNLMSNN